MHLLPIEILRMKFFARRIECNIPFLKYVHRNVYQILLIFSLLSSYLLSLSITFVVILDNRIWIFVNLESAKYEPGTRLQ